VPGRRHSCRGAAACAWAPLTVVVPAATFVRPNMTPCSPARGRDNALPKWQDGSTRTGHHQDQVSRPDAPALALAPCQVVLGRQQAT
jgi:hypothetical protein